MYSSKIHLSKDAQSVGCGPKIMLIEDAKTSKPVMQGILYTNQMYYKALGPVSRPFQTSMRESKNSNQSTPNKWRHLTPPTVGRMGMNQIHNMVPDLSEGSGVMVETHWKYPSAQVDRRRIVLYDHGSSECAFTIFGPIYTDILMSMCMQYNTLHIIMLTHETKPKKAHKKLTDLPVFIPPIPRFSSIKSAMPIFSPPVKSKLSLHQWSWVWVQNVIPQYNLHTHTQLCRVISSLSERV